MGSLFGSADFTTAVDTPVGQTGSPPNATHSVQLTLQDGTVINVFDSVETGLKCLSTMRAKGQWFLQASEDVVVVSVGVKLLVLEATLCNQKLLQAFAPLYQLGNVRFQHRNVSQLTNLTTALQQSGYCHKASLPFANNYDLKTASNPPAIQLVDYFYTAFPADSTQGTLLEDSTPITF